MIGLELVADKKTRTTLPRNNDVLPRIAKAAYRRGAMLRTSGAYIILSPPLIITEEQVDLLADIIEASFDEIESTL
jgi:adenosylmethionine-8-amino-7-oxononanoate aminotransferase